MVKKAILVLLGIGMVGKVLSGINILLIGKKFELNYSYIDNRKVHISYFIGPLVWPKVVAAYKERKTKIANANLKKEQ